MSVKNGAELLDRLIKDIVSESASSYVSIIDTEMPDGNDKINDDDDSLQRPTAFSLPKFIPLLQERILVLNPFTRSFLVAWIVVLDSIPDLELISHLPSFLGGLFKFLNDPNQDVVTATQHVLERFLDEIKVVARVKKGLAESRKARANNGHAPSTADTKSMKSIELSHEPPGSDDEELQPAAAASEVDQQSVFDSDEPDTDDEANKEGDWVPGQDVHVDYPKILEILVDFLGAASGKSRKK